MSDDRYVLITSASGGLGRALVRRLEQEGCWLALAGRDAARLREAHPDSNHLLVVGDGSTAGGAASSVAAMPATLWSAARCPGPLRGFHRGRSTASHHAGTVSGCMTANLDSAFHTLSAWVNALRAAKRAGAAVFVSTAAARIGTPNHEAVAAAKAGLEGLVRAAAATYANAGIRINAVAPGLMDTPAAAGLISSPLAREAAANQYPLPGIGDPSQLADLMAWLLLPATDRVTGQIWSMDGGFSTIRPLVR